MTPGWLADRIHTVRARSALIERLFGPDQGNGIGTGAWHPSSPEPAWDCERFGCVLVGNECVYCQEEGA